MKVALITGSTGLVGSESVRFFIEKGFHVIGIDNNMREYFFGAEGSTEWCKRELQRRFPRYVHLDQDIRDRASLENTFKECGSDIELIIHAAGQPSHDWAAREPMTDFDINATGTLNVLELARLHSPRAVFIFTSTNKVYGDRPNRLPLVELESRWEMQADHPLFEHGIDEKMDIDKSAHTIMGASKTAADIMVQEYGKYFNMLTASFRCSCLTGPMHAGAPLHGFLSYMVRCVLKGDPYTIMGYKGKQVRDNVHVHDLVRAFYAFYMNPRGGEVYNMGGARPNSCSILEALDLIQELSGKKVRSEYREANRKSDHMWYISDVRKFKKDYPEWSHAHGLRDILAGIIEAVSARI